MLSTDHGMTVKSHARGNFEPFWSIFTKISVDMIRAWLAHRIMSLEQMGKISNQITITQRPQGQRGNHRRRRFFGIWCPETLLKYPPKGTTCTGVLLQFSCQQATLTQFRNTFGKKLWGTGESKQALEMITGWLRWP